MSTTDLDSTRLSELLQLPTPAAQTGFLEAQDLHNAAGLAALLDQASRLARSDPGQAHQLALLVAAQAKQVGVPALIPRAAYIQAQTLAINGELEAARDLIRTAHEGYLALDEPLPAMRTNIGLMHVLNELGQHQEALDVGQKLINQLQQSGQAENGEGHLLMTMAYHNQGVCYRRMGRYEEALNVYATAEAGYLAAELPDRLGDIYNNRGVILLHLGRVSEAMAAFTAAAAEREAAGLTLLHAETLVNLGQAHLLLGHYTQSLHALSQAYTLFRELDALANQQLVLLHRADVYLALNLYPESRGAYQEAAVAFEASGRTYYHARALWGMGSALISENKLTAARDALVQAAALFREAGNDPLLCSVMLEQAALQLAQGNRAAAQETSSRALALVAGRDWPVQQIYARLRLADLALPEVARAEDHLLQIRPLVDHLALPHLRYRLYQRLGHVRRLQGRVQEAESLLETAVAEIETLRGALAQEAMRVSFLHDKMAAYEDLVQLYLAGGDGQGEQRAFALAERAKSRALVELLAGVVDTETDAVAVPELAQRLQGLQADLNAAYNEFMSGNEESAGTAERAERLARMRELEQAISRLRLQMADQAGSAAGDPFTAPLSPEQALDRLPADVTLLAYHILGDEIVAFVQRQGTLKTVRGVGTITAVQRQLQRLAIQWQRFRAGPDFVQQHMARLEKSTRRILAVLYQQLVTPVATLLPPGAEDDPGRLAIIPHGLLHQVPFHALFAGDHYLIDRYEIAYAPSLTVMALCERRRKRPLRRALVAAVADPQIPAVRAEAQAVRQRLPETQLLLDDQATIGAVRNIVSDADLVHLACHGLFRADNPLFSALKLHDGWLTAADVLPFDLRDALVTLSACESGRSQVRKGDEVVGLARAFLGAGAATLVVSLWLVQDETTVELMDDWYAALAGQSPGRAAALRAAQLALKERYPHPYYWAPFILVGQR